MCLSSKSFPPPSPLMSPGHAALRLGGLGESSFIGLFLIFFGLPGTVGLKGRFSSDLSGSHRLIKQVGGKERVS